MSFVKGEFGVGFPLANNAGHSVLGTLIHKFCEVKNNYILIKLSNAISFNNIQD